jgi:hypothetical protein
LPELLWRAADGPHHLCSALGTEISQLGPALRSRSGMAPATCCIHRRCFASMASTPRGSITPGRHLVA